MFSMSASDQAGAAQPGNTIRRTGRLDAPSMPVSSSAFPATPPQPSWRMRLRIWRSVRSRHGAWLSLTMRSLPQRSQVTRRNHEGNAANGSASASTGVGSGSLPWLRQQPARPIREPLHRPA